MSTLPLRLNITQPDDWHLHLRDGALMHAVLPDSARQFARAIVMPNLSSPIFTVKDAISYKQRIFQSLPTGSHFDPLMTLYLTETTKPEEIDLAKKSSIVSAVKFYPAGATTNSFLGVKNIFHCSKVLDAMQRHNIPLLIHGEIVDSLVDVFDREKFFIDTVLSKLCRLFPELKIVLEHITTEEAVHFIDEDSAGYLAGTITAHHILLNRNDLFLGGLRPHKYCLPVLKREKHRQAVLNAATSGSRKFFLGTDSAPHLVGHKECACGCAGCYTSMHALLLYAEAFESVGKLDQLEAFASFYGADFYNLPRNKTRISIIKEPCFVPSRKNVNGNYIIPLRAGEKLNWRFEFFDL